MHRSFFLPFTLLLLLAVGFFAFRFHSAKSYASYPLACSSSTLSGIWEPNAALAIWNGEPVDQSLAMADGTGIHPVLGVASPSERWIEVDLSDQSLKAWDGSTLFLETKISSGLNRTPTPVGEFHIWAKLRYAKMEGGEGAYYYNLPNVPYTMFFENDAVPGWLGYGLHGTYWHNDFGRQHSHGCVNLPTQIAGELYDWVTPLLPDGKQSVFASESNPGTRVVIHE